MSVIENFGRVHFDFGAIRELGPSLAALGIKRPLIMTDPGLVAAGILAKVNAAIPNEFERAIFDQTPENPHDAGVEAAHEVYLANGCDGIVALGGGSVIDAAKACAVLAEKIN